MIACDNYICFEKIGIGCSCIVFRAYHKESKEEVAIKLINKEKFASLKDSPCINEINFLKSLNHPNIVKLVSFSDNVVWVNQNNESLNASYLGLEYLSQGDLFLYISKTGPFNDKTARYLFHQLIEGLEYLHDHNMYHKDIKPQNLMFSDDFTLKIVDFGFATKEEITKSRAGTCPYMLPEIFKKEDYYASHADWFAAGVVLFNMVTSHSPFTSATPFDQYYRLLGSRDHTEKFWRAHSKVMRDSGSFSDDFKFLINSMLAYDPSDRPSIAEIKESGWYKGSIPSLEEFREEMYYRRKLITHFNNLHIDSLSTQED